MMIAYGHEGISSRIKDRSFLTYVLVRSLDDTYVKLADKAMESFSIATEPGAFLVDFLPACASPHLEYFYLHWQFIPLVKYVPAWFPGAEFKRKAKAWRKLSQSMLKSPYEMTKRKVVRHLHQLFAPTTF